MTDVSLNGLKVKTDSLPNDWYVSLINPQSGEPAEIMTVAKFAELFLNNNKIWTENNDGPNSKLDAGLFASKDANGYISFNGLSVNLDTINTNSFTVYNGNTIVGKPSGYGVVLTITNSDKAGTPGTVGVWINQLAFGTDGTVYFRQRIDASEWKNWKSLGSTAYSLSYNALTDTISDNYSILPPPPQIACQTIQNQQVQASNLRYPLCRKQTTRMVQYQLIQNRRNSMSGQLTRSEKLSWNYRKKTRDLNKSSISLTIARYNKCNLPRAGPPRLIN